MNDEYQHLRESADKAQRHRMYEGMEQDADVAGIVASREARARLQLREGARQAIPWQDYKRQMESDRQRHREQAAIAFAIMMWGMLLWLVATYN